MEKLYGIIDIINTNSPSVIKMSADSEFSSTLLAKSKAIGANDCREQLVSNLPDHMKDMFLTLVESCQTIMCLTVFSLQEKNKCSPKEKLIWVAFLLSNIILIPGMLCLSNRG